MSDSRGREGLRRFGRRRAAPPQPSAADSATEELSSRCMKGTRRPSAAKAATLAADGSAGPDGQITNVMEVAFARWFAGATTDLMGLRRAFDHNGDNRLDSRAPRWAEFRIWRDAA